MLTGAALNVLSLRLASFYKTNETTRVSALARVASGKAFQNPSDNIADYLRNDKVNRDIRGLQQVRRDMAEALATLEVAEEAGTYVFEDLKRIAEIVDFYHDPGATDLEKTGYKAEFNALVTKVNNTIDGAVYGGRKLIEASGSDPLISVYTDPERLSITYDVTFTGDDIADASGLKLGEDTYENEAAAVQAELNKAAAYLAKVTVQSDALEGHYFLAEEKSANYSAVSENIAGIEEGTEVMNLVKTSMRQMATSAMMAQANAFRASIMRLFE